MSRGSLIIVSGSVSIPVEKLPVIGHFAVRKRIAVSFDVTFGDLENAKQEICTTHQYARPTHYHHALRKGEIPHSREPSIIFHKLLICAVHWPSPV
jgi:hypothetical protein